MITESKSGARGKEGLERNIEEREMRNRVDRGSNLGAQGKVVGFCMGRRGGSPRRRRLMGGKIYSFCEGVIERVIAHSDRG